jgi:hypothetical protein
MLKLGLSLRGCASQPQDLEKVFVRSAKGEMVPLGSSLTGA